MIFTKSTFSKNVGKKLIWGPFLEAKAAKNREKNGVEEHAFFEHRFLCVFLRILAILARFWRPGPLQKMSKNRKNREKIDFGSHLERIGCFMVALGGFGERFGSVLGRFWDGFAQPSCLRTKLSASFEEPSF